MPLQHGRKKGRGARGKVQYVPKAKRKKIDYDKLAERFGEKGIEGYKADKAGKFTYIQYSRGQAYLGTSLFANSFKRSLEKGEGKINWSEAKNFNLKIIKKVYTLTPTQAEKLVNHYLLKRCSKANPNMDVVKELKNLGIKLKL